MSTNLLPKLELNDLSFGSDPVLLTTRKEALTSTSEPNVIVLPPPPLLSPISTMAARPSCCRVKASLCITKTAIGKKFAGANREKSSKSIASNAS